MTRRHQLARAAVLAALLAAAGCSGHPAPSTSPSPTGSRAPSLPPAPPASAAYSAQPLPSGKPGAYPIPLPSPGSVDRTDADAVAQAAVVTMWSMNTATDTSQYQAELRASWLLSPTYLAALKAAPPVGAPGAWWITWYDHRAYTTVTATRDHDDEVPDTPTLVYRQYTVAATPIGTGGWRGSPLTATVFVELVRSGAGAAWSVQAVTVSS